MIKEFHEGDYGGHHYWKETVTKILRTRFYWPSMFSYVHKEVSACHNCHIFEGKINLLPLSLKTISIEPPFQQWGLDFIGEINPSSSGQHKRILTAIDYFTKCIEAIPTRQAIDSVIIQFIEENIFHRFGFRRKIITDNAHAFKSKKMIKFSEKYDITLHYSTTYYP